MWPSISDLLYNNTKFVYTIMIITKIVNRVSFSTRKGFRLFESLCTRYFSKHSGLLLVPQMRSLTLGSSHPVPAQKALPVLNTLPSHQLPSLLPIQNSDPSFKTFLLPVSFLSSQDWVVPLVRNSEFSLSLQSSYSPVQLASLSDKLSPTTTHPTRTDMQQKPPKICWIKW